MGTKKNPGSYDCYANAEPDEPMFVLLARDDRAPALVEAWADRSEQLGTDPAKVAEARACAASMRAWREKRVAAGEMKPSREMPDAYAAIRAERARQVAKGRDAAHDDERDADEWLRCLNRLVEKWHEGAYRAPQEDGERAWETLMTKIGSVAVSALKSVYREFGCSPVAFHQGDGADITETR